MRHGIRWDGDWDSVFDGKVWKLHSGFDFAGSSEDFAYRAWAAANDMHKGLRIIFCEPAGDVVLQTVPLDDSYREPVSYSATDWDIEMHNFYGRN